MVLYTGHLNSATHEYWQKGLEKQGSNVYVLLEKHCIDAVHLIFTSELTFSTKWELYLAWQARPTSERCRVWLCSIGSVGGINGCLSSSLCTQ